jgi:hypothetical protein
VTLTNEPTIGTTQTSAWDVAERATIDAVTVLNLATVALVEIIDRLIDSGGWMGHGIGSVEHWVTWKADLSRHRAEGLVRIARRCDELPICWGLFRQGRLTEDAMVRIARRVPADRDREVAELAPALTIAQLTRVLACLPEIPDPDRPALREPEDYVRLCTKTDGRIDGQFSLPADHGALLMVGLGAARDAEFRDRADLPTDAPVNPADARQVTWVDALVRMASEAADALDASFQRTGHRGERNQVVLHQDVGRDGTAGPARLHLGEHVPDNLARFLACDAQVIVMAYRNGRLLGINPSERTPNRRLRRYLEARDGGCAHPLCVAKRWLHIHHLRHWEDGGPTRPSNLLCLCPSHHRALHVGEFTVEGDPEGATIVFRDRMGQRIEPPEYGATVLPQATPTHPRYTPPCGERLSSRDFSWN